MGGCREFVWRRPVPLDLMEDIVQRYPFFNILQTMATDGVLNEQYIGS